MQVIIYGATNDTSREIARQLGNVHHVSSFRDRLHSVDSQWHSQIACIDATLGADLVTLARKAARGYSAVISQELKALQNLAQEFHYHGHAAAWQDMAHIVVAGLLVDVGVRDELLRNGLIRKQPQDFWIWAFEHGTCAKNAFGLKVWRGENHGASLTELWYCFSRRPLQLKITAADISLLQSISAGRSTGAASLSGAEERQSALKLQFYKFLQHDGGTYRVNFPVLHAGSEAKVKAEIARVAQRILAESVQQAMEDAVQVYSRDTQTDVPDLFRHAFARLLLEHAMDEVLEARLLAEFPRKADYPWGCWFTSGMQEPHE